METSPKSPPPKITLNPTMKILFVINNFYIRGNGISASGRRTVAELKKIGEDVRILAGPNPDPNGPQPDFPLKEFILAIVIKRFYQT